VLKSFTVAIVIQDECFDTKLGIGRYDVTHTPFLHRRANNELKKPITRELLGIRQYP